MAAIHPLDPLYPDEISKAAGIVRKAFSRSRINFRVITLKEPPKEELVAFLKLEHAEKPIAKCPARVAMVHVLVSAEAKKTRFLELKVDLDESKIISADYLAGRHSYIDADYMKAAEEACLADPKVQQQIAELGLPENATVVVEPWAYATDGTNDMADRITMCWFYLRLSDNPDSNYYAYPLDVCAEVSETLQVTSIYRLPSGEKDRINHATKLFNEERVHDTSEYHPDFIQSRTTTKPLQITQPEGPSFTIKGNHISWEKWTFRVGFNYREGMTLHDVQFDGVSLFYRLSLAEMFVPYGDSRNPYQRKGAFDLGNDGAGINANNLRLGCDCVGHVKYFDGWHNTAAGEPLKLPNVICCHEVDDGILWKHTNYRTGRAAVARSRVLILQTVVTVTNYEYIFAWHFRQDASFDFEVRATGILSTAPIDLHDSVPFGTTVAPGVMAPYHQHLFCLRIDPTISSPTHSNTVLIDETHAMPYDPSNPHPTHNAFGIGFTRTTTPLTHERGIDLDHNVNRTFRIANEPLINTTTRNPISYQLIPHYSQLLLAHPSSFHARRAEFATHAVWVTRYHDDEMFPAGTYTMQSSGGEGIQSWIDSRKSSSQYEGANVARNRDVVVWHTFGSTHVPRIEDWPVMPCEKMTVGLRPVGFFAGNPALDVVGAGGDGGASVEFLCATGAGGPGDRGSWDLV